jgi:hypothetical protein
MSSEKIKDFVKKQAILVSNLLKIERMLKGSYVITNTTCGKSNCRCIVKGDLHKHARLVWRENKSAYVRAVPDSDAQWIKQMTQNYRDFKKIQRELLDEQNKLNAVVEKLRDEIIRHTKRGKSYLKIEK